MLDAGKDVLFTKLTSADTSEKIIGLLQQHLDPNGQIFMRTLHDDTDVFVGNELFAQIGQDGQVSRIQLRGPQKMLDAATSLLSDGNSSTSYIRWIYDAQYLESMDIPVSEKNLPFEQMFPMLAGESLSAYYDRFIASDASILILIGPPGTGKTSFVRGLLHHTCNNAILTYHTKLLESDEFFAQWFRSRDEDIVIMEDADTILSPRSDGNSMMHRFLNLGDGLISMPHKKMIFTTNLPSVSAIDDAILRPGRTHDVLNFRRLDHTESKAVCDIAGVDHPDSSGKDFSIAELFSDLKVMKVAPKNKFGFY
jgi:hypothetical protein